MAREHVDISLESRGGAAVLGMLELYPALVRKVAARAANKTAVSARALFVKEIRGRYNVKAKTVRSAIHLARAKSTGDARARLWSKQLAGLPLYAFDPRPRTPQEKRPKVGASVRFLKGGGRWRVAGSFVATLGQRSAGLQYGLFVRKGAGPAMEHLRGMDVAEMFGEFLRRPSVLRAVADRFETVARQEVDYELLHGKTISRVAFKQGSLFS